MAQLLGLQGWRPRHRHWACTRLRPGAGLWVLGAGGGQASPSKRAGVRSDLEASRLPGRCCLLGQLLQSLPGRAGRSGQGRLPSCVQMHVPQGSACQSDEVCGGPGGDWEEGSPKGPAPGRDGTWNQPRAARLPIRACHLCPRAGGQPTLEGHGAIATDGHGGAARSLEPAAIQCWEPSPSPVRPWPDHMPSVS